MELKELMKEAGIVGAGGAGFPSYAKLAEGADTLLVNGSECEPLLYTDFTILKYELDTVVLGITLVMKGANIPRAILAIKEHTAERLNMSEGDTLAPGITVKVLPNVYPIGDEVSLIYEATKRLVKPGTLPISVGVIVYNVETLYNVALAKRDGAPVTEKWLTVSGAVGEPCVLRVPMGVRVSELFRTLGVTVPDGHTVIDGGPSMGKVISPDTAVITKTTKSLLILPDSSEAIRSKKINVRLAVARAETACCQCTRCTDMCPRALLGYPLEPHKMVRTAMSCAAVMPKMVISATLCCGCGVCESLACNQGISPKAVINNYKALLLKNKLRYSSSNDVDVRAEREYRMIPSERWASALGVLKFDTVPVYRGKIDDFSRVEILLNTHIGTPSTPSVRDGDTVKAGEIIAPAADGLSVPQHAPFDGRVTVENKKIIIDRIK